MTAYDPDTHFVVVRSKKDGSHHHVDLRTLDAILDRMQSAPQASSTNVDQERVNQALLSRIDALESYVKLLTETVRQIRDHSKIMDVQEVRAA